MNSREGSVPLRGEFTGMALPRFESHVHCKTTEQLTYLFHRQRRVGLRKTRGGPVYSITAPYSQYRCLKVYLGALRAYPRVQLTPPLFTYALMF